MCLQRKSVTGQLPKWAKGSPQKFFSVATRYEDKGNRRYKEIELSLPNELTLEQNREIVDRFIANHLSNHYYAYAIHEKNGELSGERTPHVHIMFSERLIDDVERISERPAYKYFRRAAKPLIGEQVASFERRRQHGAPKDKKWHDKKYLYEIREDFARIQNDVLKKNLVYRVIQPVNHSAKNTSLKENELVAIIADALMGEPYAVQLVARSSGNNWEMEKDWELMSELDKDELINKKMIREL